MAAHDLPVAASPLGELSENARAWLLFFAMVFSWAIIFVGLAGFFGKLGYISAWRAMKFYAAIGVLVTIVVVVRLIM